MIDHDAAVELWERYTRGETNVFTRRLYTLQGQERFDEFRRRYRRDAEFRDTVDAYDGQVRGTAARGGAGRPGTSTLSKSILTSDEGKVYTILAHASGKFDRGTRHLGTGRRQTRRPGPAGRRPRGPRA